MSSDGSGNGFATPVPIFEWDEAEGWSGVLNVDDGKRFGEISNRLYECELAYRTANFENALRLAEELSRPGEDEAVRASALCTHFMASIASADADGAYQDMRELHRVCSAGLKSDDAAFRGTSFLCAMRVEDTLMARIFDIPNIEDGIDDVPGGLKAYMGYLTALHEIREFNFPRASGIAFATRKLMGPHYSLANIALTLVSASADMVENRVDAAEKEFRRAWKLGGEKGLIMPFVEINFILFGLRRRCLDIVGEEASRELDRLVNSYREGWFDLRKKCGLSTFGAELTILEMAVASLAALGWRNKEIATHLRLAETTVKHQLTSIYQKLGMKKRTELQVFNEPGIYETILVL